MKLYFVVFSNFMSKGFHYNLKSEYAVDFIFYKLGLIRGLEF